MVDKAGNKTGGRQKGSKNRADEMIRSQFQFFLTHACEDIVGLFDKLKDENPKQALDAIRDFAEFVLPKLARTEHRDIDADGNDKVYKVLVERVVHNADNTDKPPPS